MALQLHVAIQCIIPYQSLSLKSILITIYNYIAIYDYSDFLPHNTFQHNYNTGLQTIVVLPFNIGSFSISLFLLILNLEEPCRLLDLCTNGLEVCSLLMTPVKALGTVSWDVCVCVCV